MGTFSPAAHTVFNKSAAFNGVPPFAQSVYKDEAQQLYRYFLSKQEILDYFPNAADRQWQVPKYVQENGMVHEYRFQNGVADADLQLVGTIDPSGFLHKGDSLSPIFVADYDAPSTQRDAVGPWTESDIPSYVQGGALINDSITVIPAEQVPGNGPYKPQGRCIRFRLYKGARWSDFTTSRTEVKGLHAIPFSTQWDLWPLTEGTEVWLNWSLFLDPNFLLPASGTYWMLLSQIKGYLGGSPPISIELVTGNAPSEGQLKLSGTRSVNWPVTKFTIQKAQWVNIKIGIKLSVDPTIGWITARFNDQEILPKTSVDTLEVRSNHPDAVYIKQGIYRALAWENVMANGSYHDVYMSSLIVGNTETSVINPLVPLASKYTAGVILSKVVGSYAEMMADGIPLSTTVYLVNADEQNGDGDTGMYTVFSNGTYMQHAAGKI